MTTAIDLATRLRQRHRALRIRLAKPDSHLALLHAAHRSLDPAAIGQLLVDAAGQWVSAVTIGVAVCGSRGEIELLAHTGPIGRIADSLPVLTRWVLRHGCELASPNLRRDARVSTAGGAALALPIVGRSETVGALIWLDRLPSRTAPQLTPALANVLARVLQSIGIALENALALRRAEALSVTDDLTQLYNTRYLNQVLRREAKRATRSHRPLSLLFLDLDGFKRVNDTHGHLAGSAALVEAASVIRGSARETDLVARFGGDEFALVLPDTGSIGAAAVAERVRDRLASHPFLQQDGIDLRLTVSVGVATLPDAAASADELIEAADTAMYQVKGAGKNGVFIARGPRTVD